MVIYFKTKKLQKVCNNASESIKKLGQQMARKLQQRLMELKAASCLADISKVPPPRCHQLSGNREGQLSVDLEHPYRLLFIPANDPAPVMRNGGLDWSKVTEIEIVEIADTH
ncbi:MAG: killer suppression protein [Deltaproteobacteria bacterium]|nr:killer suppression protein [Deltaproteobacteria bacterium]